MTDVTRVLEWKLGQVYFASQCQTRNGQIVFWDADAAGRVQPTPEEIETWSAEMPAPIHQVRKLLIIDRLDDAAFGAAMQVMDSDRRLYERWQAASYILSDDEGVRALLTAIGTDPDVILAPEDDPP